jgi:hypothetical protein
MNFNRITLDKAKIIKFIKSILLFLSVGIIFSIINRIQYIYQSNQHTRFLHGLAKAGYGFLDKDWLANTINPFPVFSFLIFITYSFLHEYFFYLYYIIVAAVLIYSLIMINSDLFDFKNTKYKKILFFTLITLLYSSIFRSITHHLFDFNVTGLILEEGVAGQYILGYIFQPCTLGVFIILSIYLFLNKKPFIATFLLCLTATFHSIYIFSAGILILTYMIYILVNEANFKKAFFIGLFASLLIIPVIFYDFLYLGPTSPELMKESLNIIVNFRIPHHTDPDIWVNTSAFIKTGIIILSLFLVRKKKIFLILLIPFTICLLMAIVYYFVRINFIALLAPWRISVWLVPISTSMILGYLLSVLFNKFQEINKKHERTLIYLCLSVLFILFAYESFKIIRQKDQYLNLDHGKMMNFVRDNKTESDVYLVPSRMSGFRLNTGAPVFVTYKSHPYKDYEVIEWYERYLLTEDFYENLGNDNVINILEEIKNKDKITHVLIKNKKLAKIDMNKEFSELFEEYYKGDRYTIYKIKE